MVTASDSIRLDSFNLAIEDIASVELEKLHALSISVNWPHRAEDWQFLRETGKGFAAVDEIGRVLGTAMWQSYGADFALIGMVITSPRLQTQGAGQWLMEHVLDQVRHRDLGLNATRAARRLYLSLDFKPEATVFQCQGEATLPPQPETMQDVTLRAIGPADLEAVAALDRTAFGADRTPLLVRLLSASKGIALIHGEKIAAFALCRPFGRGHVVGPIVAMNDADAITVTRPHVAAHAGRFLRLDTRQKGGDFAEFLSHCSLPVFDTVTSMSLGKSWIEPAGQRAATQATTYALASQALG